MPIKLKGGSLSPCGASNDFAFGSTGESSAGEARFSFSFFVEGREVDSGGRH